MKRRGCASWGEFSVVKQIAERSGLLAPAFLGVHALGFQTVPTIDHDLRLTLPDRAM